MSYEGAEPVMHSRLTLHHGDIAVILKKASGGLLELELRGQISYCLIIADDVFVWEKRNIWTELLERRKKTILKSMMWYVATGSLSAREHKRRAQPSWNSYNVFTCSSISKKL